MTPLFLTILLLLSHSDLSNADDQTQPSDQGPPSITTVNVALIGTSPTQSPRVCTPRLDIEPLVVPLLTSFSDAPTSKAMEQQIFSGCTPSCQNGGMCRAEAGMRSCLCPINVSGQSCELASAIKLTKCDESTCQNGGSCVGSTAEPACSCPSPSIRGAFCERRSRWFRVLFKVIGDNTSGALDENILKNQTKIAAASEKLIDLSAKLGDDVNLARSYLRSEFETLLNQSGTIVIRLLFDMTDAVATDYTAQCILGHVMTGIDTLYRMIDRKVFTSAQRFGSIKLSNLEVQVENMCASGNHDCSPHATCKMLKSGVYTCICNSFTIDVSMNDLFPGRRCVYDGLIILIFVLVGFVLSTLIILLCGCRRTIWSRHRRKANVEHLNMVNVAKNYDI